jgi:hypothetical protein
MILAYGLYERRVAYSFVEKGLVMQALSAPRNVCEDNNLDSSKCILGYRLD